LIVIAGLIKAGSHDFRAVPPVPHRATETLGVLLVLRAFASGATAMTGIEVISNAVPVFRPPEAQHARQTLGVMREETSVSAAVSLPQWNREQKPSGRRAAAAR